MKKKLIFIALMPLFLTSCNLIENEVIEGTEDKIAEELIREVTQAIKSQNEKNK